MRGGRERGRQTYRDRDRYRQTDKERGGGEADRQTEIETDRQDKTRQDKFFISEGSE